MINLSSVEIEAGLGNAAQPVDQQDELDAGMSDNASSRSIAFVMSTRIGDTLISMVVVRNLVDHGYKVTVFSDHLDALRAWFPSFLIRPSVKPIEARELLGRFDTVLHAYAADVVGDLRAWHPDVQVMDEWPLYRQIKPMVDIQVDICLSDFGLPTAIRDNGLIIPDGIDCAVIRRRAVIHPTASNANKQWLPSRFLGLARHLRNRGYDPCFVVAPNERANWQWVESCGFALVSHASLAELAQWLVTAGVFIGNDSGVAHLASNIGVPVVSLAMRSRIARRWIPGWAPSLTLTPVPLVPSRWLKEALWKYLLPLSKVVRAVEELRTIVATTPRAFGVDREFDYPVGAMERLRLAFVKASRHRHEVLQTLPTLPAPVAPADNSDGGSIVGH